VFGVANVPNIWHLAHLPHLVWTLKAPKNIVSHIEVGDRNTELKTHMGQRACLFKKN